MPSYAIPAFIAASLLGAPGAIAADTGDLAGPPQLVHGERSDIHATLLQRIRSQRDWQTLWNAMGVRATRAEPAPPVDFSREQLIAFFAGDQRSGGVEVTVQGIAAAADRLILTVRLSLPGAGCVVTSALSQPYQIVRIDRSLSERPMEFHYEIEKRDCSGGRSSAAPVS
ncbi:MAG TPA: protease complex subunit PrcB family protein [Steroidobacteraceae bacterium]|jgi:hypothetical protein